MITDKNDMTVPPWERGVRKGGEMDQRVMTDNMLKFKEVMDKHNIKFVLIFGSLLGAVRDGGLMSYDTDADVMCFAPDHRNMGSAVSELRYEGFVVPDRNDCPLNDHFMIRNGEKIDIWWFTKLRNEWVYDSAIKYPATYFDNLEEIDFLGAKFKVPQNPRKFLEHTYGPTWITPNPKGSYVLRAD
jgi:phosphorylcholine metabolism protein LicD